MNRILVLAELNANKLGSMEEFDMFLARELTRRGDRCYLSFIAEPDPTVRKMLEEAGARIADIFHGGAPGAGYAEAGALARMAAIYRFIRDERIDLVHINFFSLTNPCLLGAYLSGAKVVYTDHASGSAPVRGVLKNIISGAIHFFLTRRVARYVAVSDFVRGRLAVTHHAGPDKTLTIYNGVNLGRFAPGDREAAREAAGVPADAKVVVAVAMLIPEKGLQYLVEAASVLVREHGMDELCVLVAGEGHYRGHLEELAYERGVAGNVRFLGRRNDVDLLVAASDAVAVPAVRAESFGLIIAEAMAAGRPVVASRVGGIPELVEDRVTGLLVEPGDSRGLAEGIGELLRDPARSARLAENALAKARERFDLERQTARFADMYRDVLGG